MINKGNAAGQLGREPNLKFTAEGAAVAQFSVATERSWKDDEGQEKKETEWHRIVTWRALAEACNNTSRKAAEYISRVGCTIANGKSGEGKAAKSGGDRRGGQVSVTK